jgi:hypothetical protein
MAPASPVSEANQELARRRLGNIDPWLRHLLSNIAHSPPSGLSSINRNPLRVELHPSAGPPASFASIGWPRQGKLSIYSYAQVASAFMAALAAAHVLYEVVPTSFMLAFVGKNPDGYCDNFCSLTEHLCEAMFCTT